MATIAGIELKVVPGIPEDVVFLISDSKRALAEAYGMGDIRVGLQFTGAYPNKPAAIVLKLED